MTYGLDNLLYLLPVLGALIAFFPTEIYPAKALSGNIVFYVSYYIGTPSTDHFYSPETGWYKITSILATGSG